MSRNQKSAFDPVILITLGLVLVTIAVVMVIFQSNSSRVNITNESGTMSQLIVAFITGLTTGGLSCLAIQGGLLASSLAHQIEQDYLGQTGRAEHKKQHSKKTSVQPRSSSALPILLFLCAKVVAYTLLGALLGWLGSYLALGPTTRAVLMILIGTFMLGNALRMFNVHPIFRYFSVEPP